MFDSFLILFTAIMLGIGSFYDIRDREISDIVWILMALGGTVIHSIQIFLLFSNNIPFTDYIIRWFLEILFSIIISTTLFLLGLWGGADLLALIAISICLPISNPITPIESPRIQILSTIIPQSVSILMNAIILTLPVPLLIFIYNIISRINHPEMYRFNSESCKNILLAFFIGYPRNLSILENDFEKKVWHYDFLERYTNQSQWHLSFKIGLDTPEDDYERKKDIFVLAKKSGKNSIWIQPTYPFILILLIGYLINVFIGNLLFLVFDFLI